MSESFDPYYKWLAIRPQDQPPTYYRLLGVSEFEDDGDVIENAADRQMAHIRSYATGKHAEFSQKLLNEIAAAKVCLLNVARKAEYDARLRKQRAQNEEAAQEGSVSRVPAAQPAPQAALPVAQAAPRPAKPVAQSVLAGAAGRRRRRRQPKWLVPALAGGGGVLLLVVIVLAMAGDAPPVADGVPPPSQPAKGADPPTPASHEQPAANPAGVEPDTSEPSERPAPQYALRFGSRQCVELQDSVNLIEPGADFTIEVWIRPVEIRSGQAFVGSFGPAGAHPDLPAGTGGGWSLSATRSVNMPAFGLLTDWNHGAPQVMGTEFTDSPTGSWVHLALTFSDGTLRLFENGTFRASHEGVTLRPSPFNVFLGHYPYSGLKTGFAGDISGLRISRVVRYPNIQFEPPPRFEADADALVVLDFDRRGEKLLDKSGNGHHGTISGATWIERSAPPQASPGRGREPEAVAELPPYALRLTSADRVELRDTKTMAVPLTVELWVRPDPGEDYQTILGNHVMPTKQQQLAGAPPMGWALCNTPSEAGKHGLAILVLQPGRADGLGGTLDVPLGGRWSHIAACLDRDVWNLFVNGTLLFQTTDKALGTSPLDLTLGRSSQGGPRARFDGYIGGLRISRGIRYRGNFEPQGEFGKDDDTLVLLDFSQSHEVLIPDRSGNGHDGVLFGGKWVKTADLTPTGDGDTGGEDAVPPTPVDDDRQVALWARSLGASIGVSRPGETRSEFIRISDPLPDYPFLITQLNLYELPLSDDDLEQFARLTGLMSLRLDGTRVTGAGMRHLAGLPALRTLSLKRTRVGDEGLKHVAGIRVLTSLNLQGTPVGDAGLVHLARLERLNVLHLDDTEISGAGLSHIAALPKLHTLYLNGSAVTGAGLAEVARLPALQFLHIDARQCSQAGLAHLAAAAHLNQLNLYDTELTPPMAERLRALPPLRILNLRSCQLAKETLAAMAGLRQLESMRLHSCGVSREDAAQLQEALPDCRIEQFEQR